MTSFYWHAEVGENIIGSGWAKSISDAHNKAAQAIANAPVTLFGTPGHTATIAVTEKPEDDD